MTVNAGQLPPGQSVYLYVLDQNGQVNPTGYPLVMGGFSLAAPEDIALTVDGVSNVIKPYENKSARMMYELREARQINISVQQRFGQEIRQLENAFKNAGTYEILWDGLNSQGSLAASGTYLIIFKTDDQTVREKVVLIK